MEIKWIEDFLALVHYQSFSRAADSRNVTQSGFSRRIQSLEQWLGAELVDRSGYPSALTPAGKLFLEGASEMVLQLYDLRAAVRCQQRGPGFALQIAAGHSISLNFLPGWLERLNQRCGETGVRVVTTNNHDSVLMLASGSCDLLFAYHHPGLPLQLDPNRYVFATIGRDSLVPVFAARQRDAHHLRLPGTKSKPVPLLAYGDTSFFGRCFELVRESARTPSWLQPVYESDMAEALKKMALQGQGLAWLPRSSVMQELADDLLAPAGGDEWTVDLEIRVYRDLHNRHASLGKAWDVITSSTGDALVH